MSQLRRTRIEAARFVIDSIRAVGLQPHRESRLMRMIRVLERAAPVIPPDDPEFETALESVRDLTLLEFVFATLNSRSDGENLRPVVRRMLKDSVLPQADEVHSPGRDVQFELFVAAVCHAAGFRQIKLEEPDITCFVGDTKFGIAVKRVKSADGFVDRVRDAAMQIQKTNHAGVVIVDTCLILNPGNRRLMVPLDERAFAKVHSNAIRYFVGQIDDEVQQVVRGKGVRAVIVHDHQVAEIRGTWELNSVTIHIDASNNNGRRFRESWAFWDAYRRGLPNMEFIGS